MIDASAAEVQLVFVDGVPLYGDRQLMKQFWNQTQLEEISLPGITKSLATPATNIVVANIEQRLKLALQGEGIALASLTGPGDFVLPPSTTAAISNRSKNLDTDEKKISNDIKLSVTALSNPSRAHFTLNTRSESSAPIQLRVLDAFGRIVETKSRIVPNSTFNIGYNFKPGAYLVEVIQGKQRQTLKLIRQ